MESDLSTAINSTKDFKAVTGTITIDTNRNAKKLAVIQRVEDGSFSFFCTRNAMTGSRAER